MVSPWVITPSLKTLIFSALNTKTSRLKRTGPVLPLSRPKQDPMANLPLSSRCPIRSLPLMVLENYCAMSKIRFLFSGDPSWKSLNVELIYIYYLVSMQDGITRHILAVIRLRLNNVTNVRRFFRRRILWIVMMTNYLRSRWLVCNHRAKLDVSRISFFLLHPDLWRCKLFQSGFLSRHTPYNTPRSL